MEGIDLNPFQQPLNKYTFRDIIFQKLFKLIFKKSHVFLQKIVL